MPRRKEPRIPDAVLDQLLAGADPKTALEPNGLIADLKKALAEPALNAEMDHHLAGEEPGNRRNGYEEDPPHRHRPDRADGAARPASQFRAAADRHGPAPLPRVGGQDHLDVRPRHEPPRDPRIKSGERPFYAISTASMSRPT